MKKILVIEDEGIILLGTLTLLKKNGFEAIGAENGLVGLRLARESAPDLILCNVDMPLLNGYQVFLELQSDPLTASIPFIFLTAQNLPPELFKQLLKPLTYLTKPYASYELLLILNQLLSESEQL